MERWINRLCGSLDECLVNVYSSPRAAVRRAFLFPLYLLRRFVIFLTRGLTFEVFALEGQAQGGDCLRVIYIAEGRGMAFLASRLFDGHYRSEKLPNLRAWQFARAAERYANGVDRYAAGADRCANGADRCAAGADRCANGADRCAAIADLLVVERSTLLGWLPSAGDWVRMPTWVRMVRRLDPAQTWEQVEQSFKKHERNIRRVKRSGFSYEISRESADFDFFFERMYSPFVLGRHQGYGLLDSRTHLRRLFEHGFLLFILDAQGKRVAADLAALYGDVYFGVASGVLNNDPDLLDAGVVSALYYYTLQWCHAHHIRACDIGEARPFEQDGLYQYKRRWGYEPARELWNTREWLFWVPSSSPAALRWLRSNPSVPEFTQTSPAVSPRLTNELEKI